MAKAYAGSSTAYSRGWSRTDYRKTRLENVRRVFAKVDRILTGKREVNVRLVGKSAGVKNLSGAMAGYSIGTNIFIDPDQIPDFEKNIGLVRLTAVNYHEVCHVLYTPDTSWHREQVVDAARTAFNILEDQRIETLFVARYRPASKYFTEMFVSILLQDQSQWDTGFMLAHGRRYLPLELRAELERRFIGTPEQLLEAKEIIDEYRLLPMTTSVQWQDGAQLAIRLQKIINDIRQNQGADTTDVCGNPSNVRDPNSGNAVEKQLDAEDKQQAERDSERAQEQTEEQDDQEQDGTDGSGFWDENTPEEEDETEDGSSEDASDNEEDEDDEDGSNGGDDLEGSDGDDADESLPSGESGGDSSGDDADDASEESDNDHGGGAGTANDEDDDNVAPSEDLEDLLNEIADVLEESAVMNREVQDLRDAMNEAALTLDDRDLHTDYSMQSLDAGMVQHSQRIERELRRIYADVEPGWRYGSSHGRLNVERAANAYYTGSDDEDVFDEWDEGMEQETGIEAVIATDLSGSMWSNNKLTEANKSQWILKRALDSVEAKTTCLGFSDSNVLLYRSQDKVPTNAWQRFDSGGGTELNSTVELSRRILNQSEMPNRLFVVITDGEWGDNERVLGPMIDAVNATRVLIFIGSGIRNAHKDQFHTVLTVNKASEIPDLIKSVVDSMLHNVIATHRH